MQTLLKEKVNIYSVFRSFQPEDDKSSRAGWEHKRIEPLAVERKGGETLKIKEVRRSYAQKKGQRLQVHFVIHCEEDRYFHLVYDADKILWILLYEFDDQMFFDDMDIDVEIQWSGLSGSED